MLKLITVTMWVDLDELVQWVDGFKQAATLLGATVQVIDKTE